MAFEDYFSVQVFFIMFRETMETAVIVSVLLAFLNQGFGHGVANDKIKKRLQVQIWAGALLGLVVCLIVGATFIFAFYYLGKDLWNATEKLWEATFSLIASVIITLMGLAMLRINKMREKWKIKMAQLIISAHENRKDAGWGIRSLSRRYAMAILPFVTTLREGLEAVVFLGGIGINEPATSFPLAAIAALLLGLAVGWVMYTSGNHVSLQYFLIGSTCFLYLVAAGLFSKGIWFLELQQFINKVGQDVSEMGSGPGSYDITKTIWHVNCCNSQTDGPWMIFNAILGWQNSATYGSVISYNLYWAFVICMILSMAYKEKHGYLPVIPAKWQKHKPHLVDQYTREEREELLQRAALIYSGCDDDDTRNSIDSSTPLVNEN